MHCLTFLRTHDKNLNVTEETKRTFYVGVSQQHNAVCVKKFELERLVEIVAISKQKKKMLERPLFVQISVNFYRSRDYVDCRTLYFLIS